MYSRRKQQLRRMEHARVQHEMRGQKREQTATHHVQMHMARSMR